ncbi:hypothetical protein GCK72_007701 [Caenorhabditis remanei]|uniref:DUF7747 domain-containing protein n=1 Tax=Caenorhabditis remanei TaxID=31234 RepID=A0A6A5HPK3_CAERE|nr:hypothetical protein GCK72_007701 [Caenorhabditis remanei]KAF1767742.1 hypothetical protein GCK72_007701 [Caenorhabditis remanei]
MPRKSLSSKETPPIEDTHGRPRRSVRKNVLYNNADYELGHMETANSSSSKKTKAPVLDVEEPNLEKLKPDQKPKEIHITRDEDMDVAMEFEIPHDNDGPPVLGSEYDGDSTVEYGGMDDASDDEEAPDLEKNPLPKRRGRPRLPDGPKNRRKVQVNLTTHIPRVLPPTVTHATNRNQRIVKVFRDELEITPEGVAYAVVLDGCLTEFMRKEKIIEMLINVDDYAQQFQTSKEQWFLPKPPRLPPLTTEKMCAVFYVDGQTCKNAKDISFDELRPWSSTNDCNKSFKIKPNVRRHPVARLNGELRIVKHETRLAEFHLTEYTARLPREQRLRKKIFYLTRDNAIVGNVLIIYDYVREGIAPVPISLPHGNNRLRTAAMDNVDNAMEPDTESPFEEDTYEGMRGGVYLKLRAGKLGWAHNKELLLDYMYNNQDLFNQVRNLNQSRPDLPPLIEDVGVFVYFVSSQYVTNQLHHAADGLSPWTTASQNERDDVSRPSRVRSTKRPLYSESDGTFTLVRDQKETTDTTLFETMTTLARCNRVRKRVLYIQQNASRLLGNVCYIYEFLTVGPLPELITSPENKPGHSTRYPKMEAHMISRQASYEDEPQLIHPPITHKKEASIMISSQESYDELVADEDDMIMSKDMMESQVEEQLQYPDMLQNGYDAEFQEQDDPIDNSEKPEAYYDLVRELSTGHVYLTVRHKKMVTSTEHVLEWICNSNHVEERGVLNQTKPTHPPIVTNARAYAFFVAGTAIVPHDITKDDFSPWSHSGTEENPTCYRTKVRKMGVIVDPDTSIFMMKDGDYKDCPFHLVHLYSMNPRNPRLRKKIYYLMETESKMVISHALILYDYNSSGDIVKLNAGLYKPLPKKMLRSAAQFDANDPTDDILVQEADRVSPFNLSPQQTVDGTYYLEIIDTVFWNDRNRQIQYLVNEPNIVASLGCLNNKVPNLPPPISTRGMFAFFVNGEEVNCRLLTADKLAPWSESSNFNSNITTTMRPKTAKTPLKLNNHGQLRVQRTVSEPTGYQLHTYMATLPRCPRLRKKVVYVERNGRQCGHALIMYNYTEHGDPPLPLSSIQDWYNELEEPIREDIQQLSKSMTPAEVVKNIFELHGVHINPEWIYNLRHRTRLQDVMEPHVEEVLVEEDEMMVDGEIVIEQSEVIEASPIPTPSHFLEKPTLVTGYVRGNQRYEAMWRIAQKQYNDTHIDDTFDKLFRLLYEKDEQRLLHVISQQFNVNIIAGDMIEEEPMNFDDQMTGHFQEAEFVPTGDMNEQLDDNSIPFT